MNKYDAYSYFFVMPLYTKIVIVDGEINNMYQLIYRDFNVDAYNPTLKENTTYSILSHPKRGGPSQVQFSGIINHEITCVRTMEKHYAFTYYDAENKNIQKIGQFLSIADFHISQIKQYDKVLEKEQLKEFTRAIGLAANGVGIGSFVYLRRIFEKLIEEAYEIGRIESTTIDKDYPSLRIPEKIELLKDYLPTFLVENRVIYGILSKGIHNLTEDECLEYFETLKVGIELILDEKLEKHQKARKMEEAKKKISAISSKLK